MKDEEKQEYEYTRQEKAVTLTNEEWNSLVCFVLMTTQYRKGEAEAWERAAQEKDENGQIKYKNAQSNAEYWRNQNEVLEEILKKIDKA